MAMHRGVHRPCIFHRAPWQRWLNFAPTMFDGIHASIVQWGGVVNLLHLGVCDAR